MVGLSAVAHYVVNVGREYPGHTSIGTLRCQSSSFRSHTSWSECILKHRRELLLRLHRLLCGLFRPHILLLPVSNLRSIKFIC
jgi:hypothetical protein